jgi:hypothetical protein
MEGGRAQEKLAPQSHRFLKSRPKFKEFAVRDWYEIFFLSSLTQEFGQPMPLSLLLYFPTMKIQVRDAAFCRNVVKCRPEMFNPIGRTSMVTNEIQRALKVFFQQSMSKLDSGGMRECMSAHSP